MPSLRVLVASLLLSSVVWAGTARAEAPPPEMVGRIAAAAGGVSLRPAGGEWADSGLNDPVASGMALRTSSTGRATLGIGPRMVTLSGGSELDIVRFDEGILQIALRQGRIGLHVARLDPGETVEIDLSRGGLWLLAPGDYDIVAGNEQSVKDALDRLSKLNGVDFDREYLKTIINNHEAIVQMLQNESKDGKDANLTSFAKTALPGAEQHLKEARALAKEIK